MLFRSTFDADSEIGRIKNDIDSSWGKTLPKLLLAKSDVEFERIYNSFIKERYSKGYKKVLKALTEKMNENIEKLGLDK